jgi:hypothetical protein
MLCIILGGFSLHHIRHNSDTEFYFSSDVLTKEEAIAMLKAMQEGKEEREEQMIRIGYPAYTTQAGSHSLLYNCNSIALMCQTYAIITIIHTYQYFECLFIYLTITFIVS